MSTTTWRVYMLLCRDGTLYTGATNDLSRRLERHATGNGARYTRSRLPVSLVYEERVKNKGAALRREAALKRLDRAEKLALIATLSTPPSRASAQAPRSRRPRPHQPGHDLDRQRLVRVPFMADDEGG